MRYYIGTIPVSDHLEHHGILGMKWGQRRYQNPDGTLTSEGKTRYKTASKFERKTLENLKAMKKDRGRLSRMSYRQRRRLDKDIDFYTKRTKGEVKKKNIISRYIDHERSYSFKDRVKNEAIKRTALGAFGAGKNIALSKVMTGEYNAARIAGYQFAQSYVDGAQAIPMSELYNRIVGRY